MKNPYFSLLATAWHYAKNEKRRYVFIYVLFLCANIIVSLNPFLYGRFVGEIQKKGTDVLSYAWIYALAFIGLKVAEWVFHGPARVMERNLSFRLSKNYLDEVYSQLIELPASWHKENHSGSTINRLRKAYAALRDFFQSGFVYLQSMLKFVFSFAAMLYFSPLFGSIAVLMGIVTIWVISKFDKPFVKSLEEVNEADHLVSSNLFDSLSNIMTIITLRLEKRVHKSLMEKVDDGYHPFKKNVVINEWKWFSAHLLVASIYCVMLLGYVYQHYQAGHVFLLGGLVTLLGFVNQFTSVFYDFSQQYTQIVQYNTDVQTAENIGDAFAKAKRPDRGNSIPEEWKTLAISDLNFSHPVKKEGSVVDNKGVLNPMPSWKVSHGLKDMNFKLQRGSRIALIGESGCGKSTLLSILRGLYEPGKETNLLVDEVQGYQFSNVSNSVTLFPQEPEIFENTFHYNITLGLPVDEEEVDRVCEITRLSDVVGNLHDGLHSMIQEKGVNLSGGQKQRLSLARGVLASRSSSIILLDEPTSSMDPKTEQEIYTNLFREFEGKTVISSLHRLHLLSHFDFIYVLEKGRVVEQGTFNELMENGEMFIKLWNHQRSQELV